LVYRLRRSFRRRWTWFFFVTLKMSYPQVFRKKGWINSESRNPLQISNRIQV